MRFTGDNLRVGSLAFIWLSYIFLAVVFPIHAGIGAFYGIIMVLGGLAWIVFTAIMIIGAVHLAWENADNIADWLNKRYHDEN